FNAGLAKQFRGDHGGFPKIEEIGVFSKAGNSTAGV
ncbi:MAG: hypothetical protein AWU57_2455, partial [Marinobacter sp. T13-3]